MTQLQTPDTATGHAIPAYPSMRAAAEMVGVAASTLQRRSDITSIPCGRERRLSPTTVLQLTAHYQNRSVLEAAHDLVAYAHAHAPNLVEVIESEVDEFLRAYDESVDHDPTLTVTQVLDELAPYIKGADRERAEMALRRVASARSA